MTPHRHAGGHGGDVQGPQPPIRGRGRYLAAGRAAADAGGSRPPLPLERGVRQADGHTPILQAAVTPEADLARRATPGTRTARNAHFFVSGPVIGVHNGNSANASDLAARLARPLRTTVNSYLPVDLAVGRALRWQ